MENAMSISDFDRNHIQEILDKPDDFDWFSAQVIRLASRADKGNLARLRNAFPEHVEAYEDWYYQRGPYAKSSAVQA